MHIGFVTCEDTILNNFFPTKAEPSFVSPERAFTPDDFIAVEHLRLHGHTVTPIVWGADPATLTDYDVIVIRSPWDYMTNKANREGFDTWLSALENAKLPVQNSPTLMKWLNDKRYLQYFAECGINTIPTHYYPAGSNLELDIVLSQKGPFILKPCISAAGVGLFFIDSLEAAQKHQEACDLQLQIVDYMLQPLVSEIKTNGEWSLVFFGGEYSHAILKKPATDSIMVHAERGGSLHFPVTPTPDVVAFAQAVHQHLTNKYGFVLYLRVDVIVTANGPVLIECEGVEPELFFRAQHHSEERFTQSLVMAAEMLLQKSVTPPVTFAADNQDARI